MGTVQIDVPAGSPWIARNNGRIAAEKDFEKAFITLPALLEQEARRYVSKIDERCAVTVNPPLDVLTERARYFVKIEYPIDASLNPHELEHRLNALVRAAWAPQRNRLLEPSLASRGSPEDVAMPTSGKGAPVPAGNAPDSGAAIPTPSPVQQTPNACPNPPSLISLDAGTATSATSDSKKTLSTESDELLFESDSAMREGEFTREKHEADDTKFAPESDGVVAVETKEGSVTGVAEVSDLQSRHAPSSCGREGKSTSPFGLEKQVHVPEAFFCAKSERAFVIETNNASLPLIVVEVHGDEPALAKGEFLPDGLSWEPMKLSIGWIHIVSVAD